MEKHVFPGKNKRMNWADSLLWVSLYEILIYVICTYFRCRVEASMNYGNYSQKLKNMCNAPRHFFCPLTNEVNSFIQLFLLPIFHFHHPPQDKSSSFVTND